MRHKRWLLLLIVLFWSRWVWADDATYLYTTINKNDNQSSAQTATTLWTPASGFRIVLQQCVVSSLSPQTTTFLFNSTTVIPILYTGANGQAVVGGADAPIAMGAADAVLKYTTTAAVATSVFCSGYERKL